MGGAAAWVGVYSRRGSAKRSVRLICATLISLKKIRKNWEAQK